MLDERRIRWEAERSSKMHDKGKVSRPVKRGTKYKEPIGPSLKTLPKLPEGWTWATVEQLASAEPNSITDGPFGSNLKSEHYTTEGPRVIRLQNIGDGVFNDISAHISSEHFDNLSRHRIYAGDLVIAALGEALPRACIIPPTIQRAIVKADCIRFSPNPKLILNEYCNLVLNSDPVRLRAKSTVHGVGRPRLNLTEVKSIPLPFPPIAEQKRIVNEVDRRLSLMSNLEIVVDRNLQQTENLRRNLLHAAFEGKFATQDPRDESAQEKIAKFNLERERENLKKGLSHKKKSAFDNQKKQKREFRKKEIGGEMSNVSKTSRAIKLLSLKLAGEYKSLIDFEQTFREGETHPGISPICLVGLNGSGKSNLIESLSEIFCYLELLNLNYKGKGTTQKEKQRDLQFEIIYELQDTSSQKKRTIKIIKEKLRQPLFFDLTNGEIDKIDGSGVDLEILPKWVIGYSSGLNETISIPYAQVQFYYSEDVQKRAFGEESATFEDSNTLFLDYDANASILIANYLLGSPDQLDLFRQKLRIKDISSFEIVFKLKLGSGTPVKLTQELIDYKNWLSECADEKPKVGLSSKEVYRYKINDRTRRAFRKHFRSPRHLFTALFKFSLLNALRLTGKEREFFRREDVRFGSLSKPPTVLKEKKVFSIDSLKLSITQPERDIDYAGISDGEHQFIQVFGTIQLFDEPGTLFLFDEPESHLNPLWRREFVQYLTDIPSTKDQEFVISTHSPFIVSGCRSENVLHFERDNDRINCHKVDFETYGSSFEYLLTKLFKLESLISKQAFDEMKKVIRGQKLEEIEGAIEDFGESFEKRFLYQEAAKIKAELADEK